MSDAPNGIFDQLCPPLPQELEHDQYLLKLVTLAISNELPKIEHLLGLLSPNSEFRDDLSHAILRCILTNTSPPKRRSQICRELKQISDDAAAAEEINRRLMSLLQGSNIYPPVKSRFLKLGEHADDYAALSRLARAHHNALSRDRGGVRGMVAFRALVEPLIDAFEKVTGQKASEAAKYKSETGEYEGLFFSFIDAVLSTFREHAWDLNYPDTRLAQDTFVYGVISERRRDRQRRPKRKNRKAVRSGRRASKSGPNTVWWRARK